MADSGEPPQITALRTNLTSITDTVTVGGNLQWFANRLVEREFIPRRVAQEILDVTGATPAKKAGQLMDSVFAVLRITNEKRRWFDEFVSIFSTDKAYAELVAKLKHHFNDKGAEQHLPNQPADSLPATNSNLRPAGVLTSQPTASSPLPTKPLLHSLTNSFMQWFDFTSTPEGESSEVTPAPPTPPATPPATGSEESPAPPSSTTSSSPPVPPPPSPHHSSFWSLEQVKVSLENLEEMFGNLHADADTELSEKETQDEMFFKRFRSRLLLLPVRKATLHVKFFTANEDEILGSKNSTKILAILCRFVDYRNFEILYYVVLKFCGTSLQQSMKDYCKMLEEFETATTVDVYLNAIPNEADEELLNGFSEMVVKIDKPESQCTLLEVRKLNKAIIKESTLCSHSVYIGAVSRNCVVVRFRFPSSAVGWVLAAITPDFMT
ncbi:hypothetical protein GBAR_LOCUS14192, partial [Geodia barretti]